MLAGAVIFKAASFFSINVKIGPDLRLIGFDYKGCHHRLFVFRLRHRHLDSACLKFSSVLPRALQAPGSGAPGTLNTFKARYLNGGPHLAGEAIG